MLTRRQTLATLGALPVAACARRAPEPAPQSNVTFVTDTTQMTQDTTPIPPMPARYGAITDEPFPVPAVPEGIVAQKFWRQEVTNPFPEMGSGSIVVDPDERFLYFAQDDLFQQGKALRYGVGVGGAGFAWDGDARIPFTRDWPAWRVPAEMIERRPELAEYSVENGGMPGGPGNPLGARALYLFQGETDTLYRIHGACEPQYVGKAVSSGCIRMLDQDVIDLESRVPHGAPVRVRPSIAPGRLAEIY